MRLPTQLLAFIYYKETKPVFLLLKRTRSRGGFWQPVSGGLEQGESMLECLKREILEETKINNVKRIDKINKTYDFTDNGVKRTDNVYFIELNSKQDPIISSEHTEFRWCSYNEALDLLKYDNNKDVLKQVFEKIIDKKYSGEA